MVNINNEKSTKKEWTGFHKVYHMDFNKLNRYFIYLSKYLRIYLLCLFFYHFQVLNQLRASWYFSI